MFLTLTTLMYWFDDRFVLVIPIYVWYGLNTTFSLMKYFPKLIAKNSKYVAGYYINFWCTR